MFNPRRKPRISDLQGTRVLVLLPPGEEAERHVTHRIRIGCLAHIEWPIAARLPDDTDVAIIPLEADAREEVRVLIGNPTDRSPPINALTGCEDPWTLQLVLKLGPAAVIERPFKAFGLMISRDMWRRRYGDVRRIAVDESRALTLTMVYVAKLMLCHDRHMDMLKAQKPLQNVAMTGRKSIEVVAREIIVDRRT